MTQYKKYLADNYTKGTIENYFKGITIFNNFFKDREIDGAPINYSWRNPNKIHTF